MGCPVPRQDPAGRGRAAAGPGTDRVAVEPAPGCRRMVGMNQTTSSAADRPGRARSWALIAITAGFLVSAALIIAVGVVAIDLTH